MSDMLLPPGNELYLAAGLTPAAGETSALEKTISMWLTRISLKRETQGSSCFQSDGTKVHASAFKIDEVDPTGAGDSFAGGFIGHLVNHGKDDLIEAVITGAAVASFTVSGFGVDGLLEATGNSIQTRRNIIRVSMEKFKTI